MSEKIRIATKDLYADVDNGEGQEIRQLIAREGDEISPALVHLVDEADTTTERVKTRSLLAGRGTSARREAAELDSPGAGEAPAGLPVTDNSAEEELREQLAEAEERAADAEQRAAEAVAAKESAEASGGEEKPAEEPEEAEVKPEKKAPAKARKRAQSKARKSAPDKARRGAKSK